MSVLPGTLLLPPETRTGAGASLRLTQACAAFGERGLIVCGRSIKDSGRLDSLLAPAADCGALRAWVHPGGEPTLAQLASLLETAREHAPDWVAAVGGGSVMDIAKAAAGLLRAPGRLVEYHDGAPIPAADTPFVAAPTTAGTGSEATIVSVLTNADTGVKKSIRHPSFMARLVILDPDLLDGCPAAVVAASGMDALTQAIESFISAGATAFTDALALKAAALIHGSLEAVFNGDRTRQADLLIGSYLAGIALSNARLGIVHGLAHPLGARFHAPHGLACAACLPLALDFNRAAVEEKYAELSAAFGMDAGAYARALFMRLGLRSPFAGQTITDRDAVIEETLASGSTKSNPRAVSRDDVAMMLDALFEAAE